MLPNNKIPNPKNQPIIYAFIDAQNLSSGVNNSFDYWAGKGKRRQYQGWKLDMQKLIIYLKDRHKISKAILFMGDDPKYTGMRNLFKSFGFDIVLKPHIMDKSTGKTKGNCDAELVLHACKIEYLNYDKAIVVTGDGDFFCLVQDLIKEGKLAKILIPNEFRYSQLFKPFVVNQGFFVSKLKHLLEK